MFLVDSKDPLACCGQRPGLAPVLTWALGGWAGRGCDSVNSRVSSSQPFQVPLPGQGPREQGAGL